MAPAATERRTSDPYSGGYHEEIARGSKQSAEQILPWVLGLLQPSSVVDVGCGLGSWLEVAQENGVEDILGVDGDWVDETRLRIPRERFVVLDLEKPIRLDRRFDLVLSLEVAEHLPGEAADAFVESLARLGPAVLFSAAIPYQGGRHHANEQWPRYWAERFERLGFITVDCIRKRVWNLPGVEWWYAQNTLLFVAPDVLASHESLQREAVLTSRSQLDLVHPAKYLSVARPAEPSLGQVVHAAAEWLRAKLRRQA